MTIEMQNNEFQIQNCSSNWIRDQSRTASTGLLPAPSDTNMWLGMSAMPSSGSALAPAQHQSTLRRVSWRPFPLGGKWEQRVAGKQSYAPGSIQGCSSLLNSQTRGMSSPIVRPAPLPGEGDKCPLSLRSWQLLPKKQRMQPFWCCCSSGHLGRCSVTTKERH